MHKIEASKITIEIIDGVDGSIHFHSNPNIMEIGESIVTEVFSTASKGVALKVLRLLKLASGVKGPVKDMSRVVTFTIFDKDNGAVSLHSEPSHLDLMKRLDSGWPISNAEKVSMTILRLLAAERKVERSNEKIVVN